MLMSDHSKSVVYMIKKKDDDDNENVYVGSAVDFRKRKWEHKTRCNNPNSKGYNYKIYKYIRENGGWDEWIMIIIEKYPCNNKDELVKREDEIMCKIKSNLNDRRAKRSKKEWRIDNLDKIKKNYENNKEKILEQKKEYRENNRDKIKERDKKWYENNKEKRLEQSKKNYENNKDKKLEQKKEYYELNKQKIQERISEKIKCDICGCEISKGYLSKHKKTLKCKDFVH